MPGVYKGGARRAELSEIIRQIGPEGEERGRLSLGFGPINSSLIPPFLVKQDKRVALVVCAPAAPSRKPVSIIRIVMSGVASFFCEISLCDFEERC